METHIVVGKTRLIELKGIQMPNSNRVFAKLEYENRISGSHYDRVYAALISQMQKEGKIDPKRHVLLENSSGNAAIALARIGKMMGYDVAVVLPRTISPKKIQLCREEGAEVIFPPQENEQKYVLSTTEVVLKLRGSKREDGKEYFFLNHSANRRTLASIAPMAEEIINDLPKGSNIDIFVPALGNGTTFAGVGKILKTTFPEIKIIGFESFDAPAVYTIKYPGRFERVYGKKPEFKLHDLPGTSAWGIKFPFIEENLHLLDDIILVQGNEWREAQEKILRSCGFSVGPTSAAGILVAEKIAQKTSGKNFLVIFYDEADRY